MKIKESYAYFQKLAQDYIYKTSREKNNISFDFRPSNPDVM